jgi:hypothetical protein
VWFDRPFRTDRWLLLRQHSPVLAHGRCFGRGDVLTEGGALVASYAQEALCSAFATTANRSIHDRPRSSPWRESVRISHKTGDSENYILVDEEF